MNLELAFIFFFNLYVWVISQLYFLSQSMINRKPGIGHIWRLKLSISILMSCSYSCFRYFSPNYWHYWRCSFCFYPFLMCNKAALSLLLSPQTQWCSLPPLPMVSVLMTLPSPLPEKGGKHAIQGLGILLTFLDPVCYKRNLFDRYFWWDPRRTEVEAIINLLTLIQNS